MLGELAELDLELARHVQAKALAAEDPDEINALGRTYQRVARSLRQTLALKAKLAREREAAAARAPRRPEPDTWELAHLTPQVRARIDRVRAAVEPYVERERPDYDEFDAAEIAAVLIELARDEAFLDTSLEDLVSQVLEIMALSPPSAEPSGTPAPGPAVHDSA